MDKAFETLRSDLKRLVQQSEEGHIQPVQFLFGLGHAFLTYMESIARSQ